MANQLVVLHSNGMHTYHPINPEQGWKIDTMHRCIIVGKGSGRTHIPLDNVMYFSPEFDH